MRKFLFVAVATFLTAAAAIAQPSLSKGNIFVNAGLSGLNIQVTDPFRFDLNAKGGYFIMDNLALVAELGLGFQKDNNSFGLDAGVRYYIMPQERGSFFADGLLGFSKWEDADATVRLTLAGGYSIFLNEHVAIDPIATLQIPFSDGDEVRFTIGAGITIFF